MHSLDINDVQKVGGGITKQHWFVWAREVVPTYSATVTHEEIINKVYAYGGQAPMREPHIRVVICCVISME